MRTGPAPSGPVTSPSVTVTRGGVARAVDSVSIQRDLPSYLPASVAGGGGITAATGNVDWSQTTAVKTRDDSPWPPGAVPIPGEAVTVDMDAGAGAHRVFTGAVDDTTGGTGKVTASSLIDHIYRLNRRVSIEPLLRLTHPVTEAGEYRRIGLTPIYIVDRVMRACGYHTTPPAEYDSAVSVPLQGSVWPEHGTVTAAGSQPGSPNSHASFYQADGRYYAGDFVATYSPRGTPKPITSAVQISVDVGTDHAGLVDINAHYGSSTITLRITPGGNAQARYNGISVPVRNVTATGRRVSLLVKGGTWTTRSSTGETATATQAVSGSTVMSSVSISGESGARVAAAIVSWPRNTPADEHASLAFTQNAHIRPGSAAHGLLDATPAIVGRRGIDVLLEISRAMCSPLWLDEDGVLRWAGPDVLRNQSPSMTVTARTSLLSLDWRVTLDHIRSTTSVAWDEAQVSVGRWPRITVWEGRKETLSAGDELREFIEVPNDEEWVGVNLPGLYAGGDTGGDESLNRGSRSWVGGYQVNASGDPAGWFTTAHGTAALSRISHRTYLHETVVNASLPSGVDHIATEVSPASSGLWPKWHGQALPILRAYGKTTWGKITTDADTPGPIDRPELVHDAGPWVQHAGVNPTEGNVPLRLANWIATQVNTPTPEVTGFEVMPDPRIQLGDVINVSDPDNLGVAFRALVVGVNPAQSGPAQSMNLSLRVISANPTHATYEALQAAWAGADYTALESAWSGQSYNLLEADPLKETP